MSLPDTEVAAQCGETVCPICDGVKRPDSSRCRRCNMRRVGQLNVRHATEAERRAARRESTRAFRSRMTAEQRAKIRRRALLATRGLTPGGYDAMLLAQGNCCAICGGADPQHWSGRFMIDHDHETDAVRGLLCSPCNRGLGMFADNPEALRSAADYLGG